MIKLHDLTAPWPSDLPHYCPECSHPFDSRINLSYARFGLPQLLRKIAWWAPLPTLPVSIMICLTYPGRGFIMAVALGTIFPTMVLNLLANCFPKKRRLKCWKCGYEALSHHSKWDDRKLTASSPH